MITTVAAGGDTTVEPYAAAVLVVRSAFAWSEVPTAAQAAAISRFGMKGFVELVVLAGFYQMFSSINQAFSVAPPSGKSAPF